MIRKAFHIILLFSTVACVSCDRKSIGTIKLHPDDPFKKTITPSQVFEINSEQDNVVEGEGGTFMVFPKGCFKNSKGEIVEENVKIELAESLFLHEMLLSNLTTTSNGKPLETDGMIYFNATANGEQLVVNKDVPIHIEIPTLNRKSGMQAYKGVRDENGNMNWVDPKEIDDFLLTVDIKLLDFLPPGFREEVEKGMPFKKYKTVTDALIDSLYYSLSVSTGQDFLNNLPSSQYNEPYYNNGKEVKKRKYTKDSHLREESYLGDSSKNHDECGINPAIIKVIKSEKYQNTFIATKEFEARLKVIFKQGDNSVLEIYIKNLDRNLYELDSIVALHCDAKHNFKGYHAFDDFSKKRQTNVKEASKYATLLKGYYDRNLAKVKEDLEKEKKKVLAAFTVKNKDAEKVINKYKKLLWKREKYRMETYGFNWTETGWINIDNGTVPKNWGREPLEITVDNGKEFDRVYTYVIYTSIKSLYRLNTENSVQFYVGNDKEKEMLMPKRQAAIAIAIGYDGDVPSMVVKPFETGTDVKLLLRLVPSSLEEIKEYLNKYEDYAPENKVMYDLSVMERFYKESERQKALQKESEFIHKLLIIAYPNCDSES